MSEAAGTQYFPSDDAYSEYAHELALRIAGGTHVDTLGNVCHVVKDEADAITDRVDHREIDEATSQRLAREAGQKINRDCTVGLGSTGMCGYGVLCSMRGDWR